MKAVSFTIPFAPVSKGRPRMTRTGIIFTPKKTRDAEKAYKQFMALNMSKPIDVPLKLEIIFHIQKPKRSKNTLPSVKPDIDNLTKLVLDSANGVLYTDDKLVCELIVKKVYSVIACVEITASTMS